MKPDIDGPPNESDEEFAARIRAETRKRIALKAKPIDLEAVLKSMSYPEPSHLGNLGIGKKTAS